MEGVQGTLTKWMAPEKYAQEFSERFPGCMKGKGNEMLPLIAISSHKQTYLFLSSNNMLYIIILCANGIPRLVNEWKSGKQTVTIWKQNSECSLQHRDLSCINIISYECKVNMNLTGMCHDYKSQQMKNSLRKQTAFVIRPKFPINSKQI